MEGHLEATEVFACLESANPQVVQQTKGLIHEILNETSKETWFLYGLIDRYVATNSLRYPEILTGIKEPHDKHLFDKLNDSLKTPITRLSALTLLGHVVCKQPSWLYKIANHSLFPSLLKLLKNDTDVPILMSALLVLVTLLPIIPANVSPHLVTIFEVFTRLAAWKTNKPANIPEEYVLHLQVGVYALFHRLYGMYPCNFLAYLRSHFGNRDNLAVFAETLRPMLEHVRMHPLLVTASKEAEVSTGRWRSMETHDVVMECAKVSLDMLEGTREENVPSSTYLYQPIGLESGSEQEGTLDTEEVHRVDFTTMSGVDSNPANLLSLLLQDGTAVASPSQVCSLPTPSASRASPEPHIGSVSNSTQPLTPPILMDHPSGLRSRRDSSGQGGQNSQPSSPFRKMASPFKFQPISDADFQGNKESACSPHPPPSPATKEFSWAHGELSHSAPSTVGLANIKPLRFGDCSDFHHFSTEDDKNNDQEVSEIVGDVAKQLSAGTPKFAVGDIQTDLYQRSDSVIHDEADGIPAAELEESGDGSVEKWRAFVRNVNRLRYYSQCGPSPEIAEVMGAPVPERSRSCPNIANEALDANTAHNPDINAQSQMSIEAHNESRNATCTRNRPITSEATVPTTTGPGEIRPILSESQHRVFPYNYLFSSALPPLFVSRCVHCAHCKEARPLPLQLSPTEILDQHIQKSTSIHSRMPPTLITKVSNSSVADDSVVLRNQITLLHTQLIFERNKREVHAERNRRLLARAKKARALEEQNVAMKDQLQLQERHMSDLHRTHHQLQQKIFSMNNEKQNLEHELVLQIRTLREELEHTKEVNQDLRNQLIEKSEVVNSQSKALQRCQAQLLTAKQALEDMQWKVSSNEELRKELESRNKELVLMGELQQKYRERFNSFPLPPNAKAETTQLKTTFAVEIQGLKQVLEVRGQQLDAHKARLVELETQAQKKDLLVTEQKNLTRSAKDEYQEQILALKEKYLGLRSMYGKIVEQNLQLRQTESPSLECKLITEDQEPVADKPRSDNFTTRGLRGRESSCSGSIEESVTQQELIELASDGEILPEFDSETWNYLQKRMSCVNISGFNSATVTSLMSGLEYWQQTCGDALPLSEVPTSPKASITLEPPNDKGHKGKQT